jgi:tungstate transport system permease protein
MDEVHDAFLRAAGLIAARDPALTEIILLSLRVSLSALALASLIALPAGAALAVARFPGRRAVVVLLNAGMGLPPVVVGLVAYLLLSRSGPLGALGILFTPAAMILAQALLISPIVAALTRQVVEDLWDEYEEELRSLGVRPARALWTLLWDARHRLVTAILAGFGRATAEVGAVLIVGGNIAHVTRVMTTTIALETSRGELSLALALGLVLMLLSLAVNAAAYLAGDVARAVEDGA